MGDLLPGVTVRSDVERWNRFAAVNDEFLPHSMDDHAARAEGFPAAIGMGNHQWAVVHRMLRDLIGPDGAILRVELQFRSPNVRGPALTACGRVTQVERSRVTLEVWTQDEDGARLGNGSAIVELAGPGGSR